MKKLLGGLGTIMIAAGLIIGGTGAFFSDTETSAGNVFAAGAFDLEIDNESYYNGNKCENVGTDEDPVWEWIGQASYPVPGTPCTTSFGPSNLDEGFLFFDFLDVKPDDEGEDTISINIQNDAWMCFDLALTSNDDESTTEPEGQVDDEEIEDDTWDGELAQNLQFVWWADDGDNVLEVDEAETLLLTDGVQTLAEMTNTGATTWSVPLADSENNAWGETIGTPLPGGETVYIAKAWCAGSLTLDPVGQDDLGNEGNNGPMDRGTGIICDGEDLGNELQTDSATVDISFRAVQARNNGEFLCGEADERLAQITVIKEVVNNDGGDNPVNSFNLFVGGIEVTSGVPTMVPIGDYQVSETGAQGYEANFTGDCDLVGNVSLAEGDSQTCTITNDDIRPNVTVIKNVIGGSAQPSDFDMFVNGFIVPTGGSRGVNANTDVAITEDTDDPAGYSFTSITGDPECPSTLGETFQLDEGVAITCTITNTAAGVVTGGDEGGGDPI